MIFVLAAEQFAVHFFLCHNPDNNLNNVPNMEGSTRHQGSTTIAKGMNSQMNMPLSRSISPSK